MKKWRKKILVVVVQSGAIGEILKEVEFAEGVAELDWVKLYGDDEVVFKCISDIQSSYAAAIIAYPTNTTAQAAALLIMNSANPIKIAVVTTMHESVMHTESILRITWQIIMIANSREAGKN
ncbi:MAG TPA: hypothetical protein VK675_02160 [Candidatus Paceibacterota bacterium]|nr:hypothetical protein [Candidatus Paceibacterota bacterium]